MSLGRAPRITDGGVDPASQLARAIALRSTPLQIARIGDSILYGSGGALAFGGLDPGLTQLLDAEGYDFQFIGTQVRIYPGTGGGWVDSRYQMRDPWVDAFPGAKAEDIDWPTISAAWTAAGWSPDLVVVCLTANNVGAGQSAATAAAHEATLIDAIHADFPNALVYVCSIPPVPSFTSVSSALNATNLPGLCGTANGREWAKFVDLWSDLKSVHQNGDVHPNHFGNAIGVERCMAAIRADFPIRRGPIIAPFPTALAFRPRFVTSAAKITADGGYATFGSSTVTGVQPGGNFGMAITVWPTSLPSGPRTIMGYHTAGYDSGHGYHVFSDATAVSVYFASGGPTLNQIEGLLSTSAPTRLVLTAHTSAQKIALWANGKMRQIVDYGGAWTLGAGANAFIGNAAAGSASMRGWYADFVFMQGLPAITDIAMRKLIERDYFGVIATQASSVYLLNDATAPLVEYVTGGTDSGAISGSGLTVNSTRNSAPWDMT